MEKNISESKAFEKVERAVVYADYEQGGLKIISAADMQSSFLIGWVKNDCYVKMPSGQHSHFRSSINWVKIFQCFKGT